MNNWQISLRFYFYSAVLALTAIASSGCEKTAETHSNNDPFRIFFAGHTYDHHGLGKRVDPRLEKLDYNRYDRIVLGGDVCSEALQDYSTLEYLDHLFDLSNENTFYVIGNHDARNGNLDWHHRFTVLLCEIPISTIPKMAWFPWF